MPTLSPTKLPTPSPTKLPTPSPTKVPTSTPTKEPTKSPVAGPTTKFPTPFPTKGPTKGPTKNPTECPTGRSYDRDGQLIQVDYCDVTSGAYVCCDTATHSCVSSDNICSVAGQVCVPNYTTYDRNMSGGKAICAQLICQGTSAMTQWCFNDDAGRAVLLQGTIISATKYSDDLYTQCVTLCKGAGKSTNIQCKIQFNYDATSSSDISPASTPAPTPGQIAAPSDNPNYCAISTGGFDCCDIFNYVCAENNVVCGINQPELCVFEYETAYPDKSELRVVLQCLNKGGGVNVWKWGESNGRDVLMQGFLIDSASNSQDLYGICSGICKDSSAMAQCSFGVFMV